MKDDQRKAMFANIFGNKNKRQYTRVGGLGNVVNTDIPKFDKIKNTEIQTGSGLRMQVSDVEKQEEPKEEKEKYESKNVVSEQDFMSHIKHYEEAEKDYKFAKERQDPGSMYKYKMEMVENARKMAAMYEKIGDKGRAKKWKERAEGNLKAASKLREESSQPQETATMMEN